MDERLDDLLIRSRKRKGRCLKTEEQNLCNSAHSPTTKDRKVSSRISHEQELVARIMQFSEKPHIEIMDEDEELDLNEILRLADENAVPPEDN